MVSEELQVHIATAHRTVQGNVSLKVFPKSSDEACEIIKNWAPIKSLNGQETTASDQTGFIWDQPVSGEAVHAPHKRQPPFQKDTAAICVDGALKARAESSTDLTMRKGDVYVFADGGVLGLQPRFGKLLCNKPEKAGNKQFVKQRRVVTVGYELSSLQKRKRVVRGYTPQLENFTTVGPLLADVPTRKRQNFTGCSYNNKGRLI